jgi:6-pyruvoyltetrahydropterin/6-carboxytetrahydropterin synthase
MRESHQRASSGSSGAEALDTPVRAAFRVTVTKDNLIFASAHFITFAGHRCEALHGHNYRVAVTVEGTPDRQSWYVYDFVALKRLMKTVCDELDHRVLLPLENPKLQIEERGDSVTVAYEGTPRYLFPRRDCVLLPIPNTTVEMLAQYLAGKVRSHIAATPGTQLAAIELEVEESFGQSATYREEM